MSESHINSRGQDVEKSFYRASAADFRKIPGSPIAYWASNSLRESFTVNPLLENIAEPRQGMATSDVGRFLRLWYEVSRGRTKFDAKSHAEAKSSQMKWFPTNKGGPYRKWFGNNEYLVNWWNDGEEVMGYAAKLYGSPTRTIKNISYYFRESITWGMVSSSDFSARYAPGGHLFDVGGPAAFPSPQDLRSVICFLNSAVFRRIIKIINPTLNFNSGDIARAPFSIGCADSVQIDAQASALINTHRTDWNSFETSWDFTALPLLHPDHRQPTVKASYQKLRAHWSEMTLEMQRLEQENNRIFIDAYGLQDELDEKVDLSEITLTCNPHYRYGGDKSEEELEAMLLADTMRELVSYAVGCMFGRYSLDKPGLILANQGETLADYLAQVPQPSFPADDDNVIPLLDGDWFPDDITLRFRQFLRVAFGDAHYEDNLAFIEQALNVKGKRNFSLRDYFLGEFYADHVKRYKKRPIYWLFSSPKGTFSALVYLHRYRPDTVSVVLNYLRDFRKKLASRLDYLQQVAINPSASQSEKTKASKEADTIKKQLIELDDYERDTLYPLATEQVELDLDHGVKVNYLKLGAALKKIVGLDAKGED